MTPLGMELRIRDALVGDLDFVRELEARSEYRDLILSDSPRTHLTQFQGVDHRFLIAEDQAGRPLGFAILAGMSSSGGSVELDRLAVHAPRHGVGKFLVQHILALVFKELKATSLWLDVTRENTADRKLYERLGFQKVASLHQAAVVGGRRQDLVIMSLPSSRYLGKHCL